MGEFARQPCPTLFVGTCRPPTPTLPHEGEGENARGGAYGDAQDFLPVCLGASASFGASASLALGVAPAAAEPPFSSARRR